MKTVIIGGGAAGLAAAGSITNGEIILLEKNEKVGKKLYITGKGRCNVTNNCGAREFIEKVISNPKFIQSAINNFTPQDTINLIESEGIKTKIERGNRVFPLSDKSSDIIKALKSFAEKNNANIHYDSEVISAKKEKDKFIIILKNKDKITCDKLIVATGGISYPLTGSTGDGYSIAKSFGHNIIPLVSALVPIILTDDVSSLQGLSLKNVTAKIVGTTVNKSEFGEMLFTNKGVSGPIILTLSSYINRAALKDLYLKIDLKPALDFITLEKRLMSDFEKSKNKQLKNALSDLLPKSLIPYYIQYTKISPEISVNSITKLQRQTMLIALKELTFKIKSLEKVETGIVTSGGIDCREVSPKTMESKLVEGLYFSGEVLDIDACTGGYNIQIALSTGIAAGKYASII